MENNKRQPLIIKKEKDLFNYDNGLCINPHYYSESHQCKLCGESFKTTEELREHQNYDCPSLEHNE